LKKYLENPGGPFCWRIIAGTSRQSAHSFGMIIDINVAYSNYWLWDYRKKHAIEPSKTILEADISNPADYPTYCNLIPQEIVPVFEKYHFIWGGKWFLHYDTMHFAYRPELFM
jgi:hypothetical protein